MARVRNQDLSTDNRSVTLPQEGEPLRLVTVAASACSSGSCPTVYVTNRNTVVVQGYTVTAEAAGVELPAGELLVEIPVDILTSASRAVASGP